MTPPPKRTFAMFVLIVGLVFYAAGVVSLASAFLPMHWSLELLFYAVAGVAWVLPAGLLLKWGGKRRDDKDEDQY